MNQVMMAGCDLHEQSLVLQVACEAGKPMLKRFANSKLDRLLMLDWLRARAEDRGVSRIVFAFEASGQGFGLCDELPAAGVECYVLAPSKLPQSRHTRTRKTDPQDALRVLEVLRGHVLAGNELPSVWVPSRQLRDDRELVRQRLSVADDLTRVTSLVFLTELGDMSRFRNRRQLGSDLGLAPSSYESGEVHNRKGHITRAGSARLRKVLCQAVWTHVRFDADARADDQRLKAKNPNKTKIAIVAGMRRLGIQLWHIAHAALQTQAT